MDIQEELEKLKKELRITRVLCTVSSLLTAGLLIGIVFLSVNLLPLIRFAEDVRPVMGSLKALDVEAVNGVLDQLETVDLKEFSDAVEQLDMDTLNDTLEQVDKALEDMDMEAVSTAVQNLNGVVDTLKSVSNTLSSFFGVGE